MNDFIGIFLQYHKQYYIFIIPVILILQSLGLPVGGTFVVIVTGALSYVMGLNVFLIWFQVWLFASIADGISFLFWRKFGKKFISRPGKISQWIYSKIENLEKYFNKYGKSVIFLTRFPFGAMGAIMNISAAITDLKFKTFIISCFLGELIWSSVYIGLGYWFGDGWESIYNIVSEFSVLLILIILLIGVIYFSITKFRRFIKNKE
jgi:membrane-associated protein